ncbi:MAG: hypothetical protein HDQ93_02865, partial [Desulfovibrio sp.]|nr:hypothetical protein [Desulfovibrio sp.]
MKKLFISVIALLLLSGAAMGADEDALKSANAALEKNRYEEAAKILKPVADGGNPEALYAYGELLRSGKG